MCRISATTNDIVESIVHSDILKPPVHIHYKKPFAMDIMPIA